MRHDGSLLIVILAASLILSGCALTCWYATGLIYDLVGERERMYKTFYCLDSALNAGIDYVRKNQQVLAALPKGKTVTVPLRQYAQAAGLDSGSDIGVVIKKSETIAGAFLLQARMMCTDGYTSQIQCLLCKQDVYVVRGFTFGTFR